ncbi:Rossmann-fold NAD(P)-binding domain-containing protein [Pseudoxanthomonas japonensis]|uniref:NAD-dependent dehydratase n=1 Tax=Pseudoxanthomonas japonensis TaxID=69284 RepID=A0ABQ6ZIR1_9GAMM|nr:NAD-dependent dehydratase [Pseudoxanthomonas japonensis]KAF1725943.1 NAD-dependent dehydratase [Pseudoxanthomonas japonensis]
MTRVLLAGATGLVGEAALQRALASPRVQQVVAPTRRPLAPHPRLLNPVVDFDALPADADWWRVDAVACALGTTIRDAGSQDAFRRVDHDYPLAIARHAHAHGAATFVLVSAMGADAGSRVFYSRTKGDVEDALAGIGFASLTLLRPGLLGGERRQHRGGERIALRVLGALDGVLPQRYRIVPADRVADALLHAALDARPGRHVIPSERLLR